MRLRSLFPDNRIGGKVVRVVQLEKLPKRHRVVVHVDKDGSAREATVLMDRESSGLNSKGWIIAEGSEKKESISSHFATLIDHKALQVLKARIFRPHCEGQRAAVKPLEKPRKEEETTTTVLDK